MTARPQNPFKFVSVGNFNALRAQHPQGMLAKPGSPEAIMRYLNRLQMSKTATQEMFDKALQGEIVLTEQALADANGMLDLLGVVQHADGTHDTAYYKDGKNTKLVPEGYEPIKSFGRPQAEPDFGDKDDRILKHHIPCDDSDIFKEQVKSGAFSERLSEHLREKYQAPVHHAYNKKDLKEAAKHTNIGPEGYINHPETGLQAAAFMNHERKSVIIGIAGLNFEMNEMRDALIDGGEKQFKVMQQEVRALLMSGEIPDDYEVVLTGHSMGAAISQRLIYDLKQDQGFRMHSIRAVNFDAPQVGNFIEDFDPTLVSPDECVNINFTDKMGRFDFSPFGRVMGGGHVGQGFHALTPNFAQGDELTEKGKEAFGSKVGNFVGRGVANHQMKAGEEAMATHVLKGEEVGFVQTVQLPQQQKTAQIDERGFISISHDEVFGRS